MKTILLTLPFAAALACAQTNPCASYQQNVTVQLTAGGAAQPETACVAKQGLVKWCSNDGDFTAGFASSPFASGNTHPAGKKGNCTKPEKVKACAAGKAPCQYSYTATVAPGGGDDPVIIVER